MDQIIRMIMRQLTRTLVNKGVSAGLSKASSIGRKPASAQTANLDDPGASATPTGGMTKQQVRQQRQAKRAAKQTG